MIQDRGEMLIVGSAEEIRQQLHKPRGNMDELFIDIVHRHGQQRGRRTMQDTINDRLRRMRALTHKEFLEVGRDKSSLMMGILLPIILILVIGFGISLDVKNAPIAVVLEDNAPEARQMVNFVDGSEYFKPVYMTDIYQAVQAFETRKVDAILRVPPDFSRQLHQNNARLQLILYGVDTLLP